MNDLIQKLPFLLFRIKFSQKIWYNDIRKENIDGEKRRKDKDMKNFELNVSKEEKFYTPFPGPIADKVSDWLTRNNVENKVLNSDEVPEDVQRWSDYHGRKSVWCVAYVCCGIQSEELMEAVNEKRGIPAKEW